MEKYLTPILKALIFCVVLIAPVYFLDENLYHQLIQEDGAIEYLTAFLLLILSILLLMKVMRVRLSRGYLWLGFGLLVVLGLFFGFGEEISWGQRIFSVESSDFFKKHNTQYETNLHNLKINGVEINRLIFTYLFSVIFGIYFLFLLVGYKKSNLIKRFADKLGIPIPKAKHSLFFVLTSAIIFIVPEEDKKWELWECLFVLFIFLVFMDPYNSTEKLLPSKPGAN